jgi:hypothetical protein
MSDKLLKDGLRTSDKIGGVSVFAELLFVRLILATCGHGRCPWNPDWILMHALPNRPRTRPTAIAEALKALLSARLIARYHAPDGTAYVTIPNHGQRFKHAVRSPWPAPPGGPPDAEGQEFFGFEDRREEKGGKARQARETDPLPRMPAAFPNAPATIAAGAESDAEWIARLQRKFPDIDIAKQLAKAHKKRPGDVERDWFERSWLPNVSQQAPAPEFNARKSSASEPAGDWREAAKRVAHETEDSDYRERRLEAAHHGSWSSFGPDFRRLILTEMTKRKGAAA